MFFSSAQLIAFGWLLASTHALGFLPRSSTSTGSRSSEQTSSVLESTGTQVADLPRRTSILTEITDVPGTLHEVLRYFWKYDIDLTHIESRPTLRDTGGFNIYIDFEGRIGEEATDNLMRELKQHCKNMLVLDEKEVPWFPRHISDLDTLADRVLDAGTDLESDHPGFNDPVYRKRRMELAEISKQHRYGNPVAPMEYTDVEVKTWGVVYNKLKSLQKQYACPEYLQAIEMLEKGCGYGAHRIPQIQEISDFLGGITGFQLRPVTGLLSSRDFLNGLAFRTFFSTQYIRHSSEPLYTPEPDICHELLGHVPMFADPDFADFSQEIGLASLGASDEDIKRLATCYWHSVEFGLVRDHTDGGKVKAYGAGLLSSFGELEYSCKNSVFSPTAPLRGANWKAPSKSSKKEEAAKNPYDASSSSPTTGATTPTVPATTTASGEPVPQLMGWNPAVACDTTYPITTYQPTYFVAESLADAKNKMRTFCQQLPRPFFARYNPLTNSVWVDRALKVNK